jgi:hypothetical protein
MIKDARSRRQFAKTRHPIEEGPACRIYGSMDVKKVTGNLHVVRARVMFTRKARNR